MGVVYGLIGAILFGANGSLTKAVMAAGMTPLQVTFFRSVAMCLLAALTLLAINRRAFRIGWAQLGRFALLGAVGMTLVQLAYASAIERLPVGIALMIEYLAVLAVAVIARVFFKERVKPRVWVAIVLVLGGIAVVSQVWLGELDGLGLVFAVGSAAALTFYFVYGERQIKATGPITAIFWASLFASVLLLCVSGWWTLDPAAFGQQVSLQGNLSAIELPMWLPLAVVVTLGTFVPFVLAFLSIRMLGATAAGVLASSEVVFAFAVAWVWLGEALDWLQVAGAVVVMVGIVLAQTARVGAYADPDLAVATGPVPTLTGTLPRVDRSEPSS